MAQVAQAEVNDAAVPVKPAPLPTKQVVAQTIGAQVQVVKLGLAKGAY